MRQRQQSEDGQRATERGAGSTVGKSPLPRRASDRTPERFLHLILEIA
jgi:hypothetical protein